LRREARAASALDHANIGVIYGLEESEDGQVFIVMGYYEGETLAQKIARGLLPVSESVNIAMQIASGLASAHARNIVHRDTKPSNVIVTNEKVVKIVDFGLARMASTASATHSITTTGTLPYMAPEQILGEAIDQRSDVWALGVILVQMLTGSHAFLRSNTGAMTFAILNQPPAAINAVIPPAAAHRFASAFQAARAALCRRKRNPWRPRSRARPIVGSGGRDRSAYYDAGGASARTGTIFGACFNAALGGFSFNRLRARRGPSRMAVRCNRRAKRCARCGGSAFSSPRAKRESCGPLLRRRRKTYRGVAHRHSGQRSRQRSAGRRADGFAYRQALQPRSDAACAVGGARQRGARPQNHRAYRGVSRTGRAP
jgi:hypothetical protein